jgi:catechol-2,3-dioxygenase
VVLVLVGSKIWSKQAHREVKVDDPPTTTSEGTQLPGLRGIDHIGITVPDIEQASAFFVAVLGCELL